MCPDRLQLETNHRADPKENEGKEESPSERFGPIFEEKEHGTHSPNFPGRFCGFGRRGSDGLCGRRRCCSHAVASSHPLQVGHDDRRRDCGFGHCRHVRRGCGRGQRAKVVVFEKGKNYGGAAVINGGIMALQGGTKWQREHGVEDTPARLYAHLTDPKKPEYKKNNPALVKKY